MSFDPAEYGPVFGPLLSINRRRALDEGRPVKDSLVALKRLSLDDAFEGRIVDPKMARCCLAGTWLLHDYLDQSHTISQSISTSEGSFWHGAMHRREGDYSNAKYWFRNAGDHPVYEGLAEQFGDWDPYDFVDRCQAVVQSGDDAEACIAAQQAEWEAMFDWCWRAATSA